MIGNMAKMWQHHKIGKKKKKHGLATNINSLGKPEVIGLL
jgi:hypothetical protein